MLKCSHMSFWIRLVRRVATHPVDGRPAPQMLQTFHRIVWRQDVDHPEIIDDVHGVIGFVGSAQSAFILIKQEMPSIGRVDRRQFLYRRRHGLWIRPLYDLPHRGRFRVALYGTGLPAYQTPDVRLCDYCQIIVIQFVTQTLTWKTLNWFSRMLSRLPRSIL